jgi:hypothetical protein
MYCDDRKVKSIMEERETSDTPGKLTICVVREPFRIRAWLQASVLRTGRQGSRAFERYVHYSLTQHRALMGWHVRSPPMTCSFHPLPTVPKVLINAAELVLTRAPTSSKEPRAVLFEVTSQLYGQHFLARRRFSEFDEMDCLIRSAFRGARVRDHVI